MSHTRIGVCALVIFLAGSPGLLHAQLLNPGFETGSFTNWTTIGDCTVVGPVGTVNPDSGTKQAQITSDIGSVNVAAIETFLGLAAGSLDGLGSPALEGSAIKQTIVVTAGTTLTIRYNFLTNENTPDANFNDFAFFCVVGPGGKLVRLANTQSAPFVPATGTPWNSMTGYRTFTHTFTASGTVTIGLGVMDMTDTLDAFSSALFVDGSVVTPGVTIAQTGGVTNVTEGGASDTYTVVLNSAPTANVTISLTPDAQVNVAPASLTFTPANWSTPQTVTISAVDDFLVEGPHVGVVTHTAVSVDPIYNGVAIANLTANITDNDVGNRHTLSTGVGDGSLTIEVDAFGTFGDRVGTGPGPRGWGKAIYNPVGPVGAAGCVYDSYVVFRIGAAGPRTMVTGPASVSVPGTLTTCKSTFTISGGKIKVDLVQSVAPQFIGPVQIGSVLTQTYTLTNTTAALLNFEFVRFFDGDLKFDGSIQDGGGRLAGPPETFFETDKGGTSATSTTFVGIQAEGGTIPAVNRFQFWDTRLEAKMLAGNALTDTIFKDTAPVDGFVDTGSEYDVHIAVRNTFALAAGASTTYTGTTIFGSGSPAAAVSGVSITESGGSTDVVEGGATDNYTVVLKSAPTANVTINLAPDSQVTVAPASLTFTPLNWNVPQTVTVTAVDDSVYEGTHTGTINHSATSADAAYNNISIRSVVANITDNEPPPPPPPPPTGPRPDEGTYAGSHGPLGPEGSDGYGFGGGQRLLAASAPILSAPTPVSRQACELLVCNVSYRRNDRSPPQGDDGVLVSWSLALLLGGGALLYLLRRSRV